jgi:DhnA family fructose-bisphosphate aldolase class Ia
VLLGKQVRLNRLLNSKSKNLLAIAIDHGISRGVLPGLVDVQETIKKIVEGKPDSITMMKGIAEKCFAPYAGGETSLILKATSFSPYQYNYDTPLADVEDALKLGADAIAIGVILGGDDQYKQISHLSKMTKEAAEYGMPVVSHIYPRGKHIENELDNITYAVRVAAELGVDLIKTHFPGTKEKFQEAVAACPAKVMVAGGSPGKDLRSYFQMTRDVIDAGGGGVTYGRFVWQHENPALVISALSELIHNNASVDEALKIVKS